MVDLPRSVLATTPIAGGLETSHAKRGRFAANIQGSDWIKWLLAGLPTSPFIREPHLRMMNRFLFAMCLAVASTSHAIAQEAKPPIDFAHEVVPILRKHCAECHTGDQKSGGFSLNTREQLLEGGENGKAVDLQDVDASRLLQLVVSKEDDRMPPEGDGLSAADVEILRRWLRNDAIWEPGFQFQAPAYEPPLRPRRPELPPAVAGRSHPIDRLLDRYLADHQRTRTPIVDDATFARRSSLDLIGLLPTPDDLDAFIRDTSPDKRARWVDQLLARDVDYAEHWLTFWNDLLRNDYGGTGFITNGRKQVSRWLYDALVHNKPFNQMAIELIAPPTDESRGYIDGIRWRGEVSAGQTVEIQFAQSIGQSFLGINMKCASCHDSFLDRWKLDEAYGLAAIYASAPLEIHRCDKPVGRQAKAAWLFPELGNVDPSAPQAERLRQLAGLMTHPENGRFTRTMANRLWQRLMGRGIVHPLDAMQSPPFDENLLDCLAVRLSDDGYDLKKLLRFIATSQAYQEATESINEQQAGEYVYSGPRSKRMSAEQFVDSVWQLTSAAPTNLDAPVLRGKIDPKAKEYISLQGEWIWGDSAKTGAPPAGETLRFQTVWELPDNVDSAGAIITCDNEYTLFVNGKQVAKDPDWTTVEAVSLTKVLKAGKNQIVVIAKNAGDKPNAAALYFEANATTNDRQTLRLFTNDRWQYSTKGIEIRGKLAEVKADDLQPVHRVEALAVWQNAVNTNGAGLLAQAATTGNQMVRASLLKSDALMRSLGRPNRDQIVSQRPNELTTLEAIDLANGQTLADWLHRGAEKLSGDGYTETKPTTDYLYRFALSRPPTDQEMAVAVETFGNQLNAQAIEDLLWALIMLPEFQLVR